MNATQQRGLLILLVLFIAYTIVRLAACR